MPWSLVWRLRPLGHLTCVGRVRTKLVEPLCQNKVSPAPPFPRSPYQPDSRVFEWDDQIVDGKELFLHQERQMVTPCPLSQAIPTKSG